MTDDGQPESCFTPAVHARTWGNNETLDHIPKSCLMVHVAKVVNIVHTQSTSMLHACWHLNCRDRDLDQLSTSILTSSMLQSQGQTLQRSTASEHQISPASCCAACMMLDACNSSIIYPRDYVTQENEWSSASGIAKNLRGIQFLWIISLDRCIVQSSVVNQTTALLYGNDALTMDFEIGPPLPTTCTTNFERLNSSVCIYS
jgi:hypothetical protein